MLPSRKRCFTAADALLLLAAAFRILLQSTPASLSATCFARSGLGACAQQQSREAMLCPSPGCATILCPNSLAPFVEWCQCRLAAWYMALA